MVQKHDISITKIRPSQCFCTTFKRQVCKINLIHVRFKAVHFAFWLYKYGAGYIYIYNNFELPKCECKVSVFMETISSEIVLMPFLTHTYFSWSTPLPLLLRLMNNFINNIFLPPGRRTKCPSQQRSRLGQRTRLVRLVLLLSHTVKHCPLNTKGHFCVPADGGSSSLESPMHL